MPSHNRHHSARLLAATIVIGFFAAGLITAWPSSAAHPPERIVLTGRAVPINPTALPAELAPTTTTTTTTTTTIVTSTTAPAPRPAKPSTTFVPKPTPPTGTSDVTAAIAAHFDTGELYNQAVRVADCESTLNPTAVSRDGRNWGLFQINVVHRADFEQFTGRSWDEAILDADANAAYARKLFDDQGWAPWSCRWAAG